MKSQKSPLIELILEAQEMGLLDSDMTLKCDKCHVIFPKEYTNCPSCSAYKSNQNIQIDFEI